MAGNRHPWRDIYSVQAWNKILEITRQQDNDELDDLTTLIREYHDVQKDTSDQIDLRIAMLKDIRVQAASLIVGQQLDITKQEKTKKYNDRGNRFITDLGPWLASLARTCGKKCEYLATLKDYERTSPKSAYTDSAASYLAYMSKVQQKRADESENMLMTAGNRMERLDPVHRGGGELELHGDNYVRATTNPLSKALYDWLDTDSKVPFFLWLENHAICVASPGLDNLWNESLRTVKKTSYPDNAAELYAVTLESGCLWSILADPVNGRTKKQFNTADAILVKGEVHAGGQYAFAWATDGQIYSAAHKAGTLHHSSFTQGRKVKAAGMWSVTKEGKVRYVDDNTGHYHTDAYHLFSFVEYLDRQGLLTPDAVVLSHTLPGDKAWAAQKFLAQYRDPKTRNELRATISKSAVKVRDPQGTAAAAAAAAPAAATPPANDLFAKLAAFKPPGIKKPPQ
jgi:hypothetical protein